MKRGSPPSFLGISYVGIQIIHGLLQFRWKKYGVVLFKKIRPCMGSGGTHLKNFFNNNNNNNNCHHYMTCRPTSAGKNIISIKQKFSTLPEYRNANK